MRSILVTVIRTYRLLLSPLFGNCCRFEPSCSRYAEEAIIKYGVLKGGWLALWRVLRCNPFLTGGYDPLK